MQAKYDYGPRKSTTALVLHMTEGNGTIDDVKYLARNPARGVSANFVALHDGTIWQMLDWDHASGSLNPADRSTNKAYYGRKYLLEALPDGKWEDPNTHVLSMEIGGKAAIGPTRIQADAVIQWAYDMQQRFPTLTGIFGHADQTNTKPCPGTSAEMKRIFTTLGHGVLMQTQADITSETPALVDVKVGTQIYDINGTTKVTKYEAAHVDLSSPYACGSKRAIYYTPAQGVRAIGLVVPVHIKPVPVPTPPQPSPIHGVTVTGGRTTAASLLDGTGTVTVTGDDLKITPHA